MIPAQPSPMTQVLRQKVTARTRAVLRRRRRVEILRGRFRRRTSRSCSAGTAVTTRVTEDRTLGFGTRTPNTTPLGKIPTPQIHRGIDAIRRQFERWHEAYPDLQVKPLEAKGNGDRVFLWVRFTGHGAASGVPMEMEIAHVYTMREGKAVRVVEYFDKAEALEGLRE